MTYSYYYNNVPEDGLVRNNLIYTSLISDDKKRFVQWYYNDTDYHRGQNQVIDPRLMKDRWDRELMFSSIMRTYKPQYTPKVLDIDLIDKKLELAIDGVDFWQQSLDANCTFDEILPDWQEQMLAILQAHKDLNFYKYSLHPSSYFIVDGKLKSINYFFCYTDDETEVPMNEFRSHISFKRQEKLEAYMSANNLTWDSVLPYKTLQLIALESFRSNYPDSFIDKAKEIYND